MDEKNLENEMQEQMVQEQPVQEPQTGGIEPPVQEPQTDKLVRAMQPGQPVQPEQSVQPEQPWQVEQPIQPEQPEWAGQMGQEPQAFQTAYNAYGDMMTTAPAFQNEVPAPKKKKGPKIALISAICVAVVAIIGLVIFLVTRKTPEEVVRLAVTNTVNELQDTDYNVFEEVFGVSEYNMDDIDVEMSFSVDEVMDMVELNGSNISMSASAQKNAAGTTDCNILSQLTIAGETLSTNLYYIQDVLYLEMPEILNSVISMDMNEIDPSAFAFPITEEDKEIEELYDSYMDPAKEALKEAITYEKVDKVKITNHNNENVNTTQYTMTIPVAAVKDYIQAESDYLLYCADKYLTDEEFQDSLGITRDEFKQVVEQLPNYFTFLCARDFVFTFYVHDDKLARTEFQYKFSLLGISLDISADFMGDGHVLSDVYATCDISGGDSVVTLIGEFTQSDDSKELNSDASFTVIYEEAEVFNYHRNQKYDTSSGAYSETASISDAAGVSDSTITAQGRIYDVEKGKGFRADFDSISISHKGKELVKCSASFAVGNMGKDVIEPNYSKLVNFDEIDEDTLMKMIDIEKMDDLLNKWGNVFGADDLMSALPEEYEDQTIEAIIGDDDSIYQDELELNEYDGIYMKNDKYKIEIHEPKGYSRSYADITEIDLDNDKYSVYFSLEEVTDKEEKCEDFMIYYNYFDSSCEILDTSMKTAVLPDGTEIDCYVISVLLYNSDITDMYFFYPLGEDDYLICNVEAWEKDADIQAAVEEIVNDDVIKVN